MKHILGALSCLLILTTVLLTAACQKQRTPFLQVDDSRDLLTISDYEGKDYPLQTQDSIHPAAAKGLKISDQRSADQATVRNFDFVHYEAADPLKLTDSTLMLGKSHHQYSLRYVFTGGLIKVMKVGTTADMASDEIASAEKLSDGRVMVPLVSYKVTYYKIDHTRNDLNEPTAKLEAVTTPTRSGATNFKIDYSSKTAAVFLPKMTTFTSQLFFGDDNTSSDWYFSSTVLHTNYKVSSSQSATADMIASDKYGRSATKVRARKIEDRIVFNNLSIDDRLVKKFNTDNADQTSVVSIPVKFEDFRMKLDGQTSSVTEEAYTERAWDKREYAEYDLKKVSLAGFSLSAIELVDVQMDDGYFSFTVKYDDGSAGSDNDSSKDGNGLSGLIRYSFLNVKNYQQNIAKQGASEFKKKIYFPEDQKLFGYFSTAQDYILTQDRAYDQNARKFIYINRYNPTRREIEYRLNNDAPEWLEEIVLQAEAAWNASLEAAGVKFRIHSSDNGKVLRGDTGDLRYSMVNFLGELEGNENWGGVAQSLVDPTTGEIISATANVNLSNCIDATQRYIFNWIRAKKLGMFDQRYIVGFPLPPSLNMVVDKSLNAIRTTANGIKLSARSLYRVFDPTTSTFSKALPLAKTETKKQNHSLSNHFYDDDRYDLVNGHLDEVITSTCTSLTSWADKLNGNAQALDSEEAFKLVSDCAIQVVKPNLLGIVLHEMGHTLGLRHNFYGSTDKNNFYAPVKQKIGNATFNVQWKSSSIMDYLPFSEDVMGQPGLYDIAAIRWGYADRVESVDGQMLNASPDKPTRPQLGGQAKKYKYCTDEDIDVLPVDPMCLRDDLGTTPTEIVTYFVNSYNLAVAGQTTRFGRESISGMTDQANSRQAQYMEPMTKFYEKWRLILSSQLGPGNEYLQTLQSTDAYNSAVAKVTDKNVVGVAQAELNSEYKSAASLIFHFFKQIAFLPDYSCIAVSADATKEPQLLSFSILQKIIFQQTTKTTVRSCQDKVLVDYVKKTKNLQVTGEMGYPMYDKFPNLASTLIDQRSGDPVYHPDVVGLAADRENAIQALMGRTSELADPAGVNPNPSFLDEFPFAQELQKTLFDRILVGQPLDGVKGFIAPKEGETAIGSANFISEKALLLSTYNQFIQGLAISNNPKLTTARQAPYLTILATMLTDDEKNNSTCLIVGESNYCAKASSLQAKRLLDKLQDFSDLKNSVALTDDAINKFYEIAAKYVPAEGHGAEMNFVQLQELDTALNNVDGDATLKAQIHYISSKVLDTERTIWKAGSDTFTTKLGSEDISDLETYQKSQAYRKTTIAAMAEKIAFSDGDNDDHPAVAHHTNYLPLDMALLKTRVQGINDHDQELRSVYQLNAEEYDAQAEILTSIIANQSGD